MEKYFGLQWHLTDRCDQRCKHCYIWQKYGSKETPSLRQCAIIIDEFLLFCKEMEVLPHIAITGGDPLLYPHIWQVLKILKQREIGFSILGNPFHLDGEVAAKLKRLGCKNYQMSLDGLETTHDHLRKPGSFKATLDLIPTINQSGLGSTIMSTVSLLNYKELPALARLCVEYEVKSFAFSRYCPTRDDTEYNIPPKFYRQFLADMWKVYSELVDCSTNFSLKDHLWKAFLYEEGLYKLCEEKGVVLDGCNCGIKHMTLLPNGAVYACRRFDSMVGKIGQQTFKEIFLSSEMEKYREIEKLASCKDCELLNYCRGCHAVSAGATGSFFNKDPQCWRC
ncbi:radical SAM/SPASM domain protein, ACGX system [Patescibacteria group bacterium]|nr:radical SAM/SPASM domain protein, ACGX system [Patescibacteria group bacterium]